MTSLLLVVGKGPHCNTLCVAFQLVALFDHGVLMQRALLVQSVVNLLMPEQAGHQSRWGAPAAACDYGRGIVKVKLRGVIHLYAQLVSRIILLRNGAHGSSPSPPSHTHTPFAYRSKNEMYIILLY